MQTRISHKPLWLIAILLFLAPLTQVASQDITPEEIKATYIIRLAAYTKVGNPAHLVQTVCYYEKAGIDPQESVGQILAKYSQNASVTHKPAPAIKRFEAIRAFNDCDIFFIPSQEETNIDNILTELGSRSTLTISGAPRFIVRGGMIGFVLDDSNHVKMEANLDNIKKHDIDINAQVLQIMQQVIRN